MVAERQSPGNGYRRGPTTVDFFLDKKRGYSADIFSKGAYENRKDELSEAAIDLAIKAGLWTPPVARKIIMEGMKAISRGQEVDMIQEASMIFFRRSDAPSGKYVGFSWQEVDINTVAGEDILTLYLRLRVIEERHRGKHLGRAAVQLALNVHNETSWIAHRTGSPAAAWSFMQTGVKPDRPYGIFKPKRRFPWDNRYDYAPLTDPVPQQLLTATHFRVRINGKKVDMSTGVSKADYPEKNGAYELDPEHAETVEIKRIMEEELEMELEQGDSLIAMGELA